MFARCLLSIFPKRSTSLSAEKLLAENSEETRRILNGELEMELQEQIDFLLAELEDLDSEIKTKQEQVSKF